MHVNWIDRHGEVASAPVLVTFEHEDDTYAVVVLVGDEPSLIKLDDEMKLEL